MTADNIRITMIEDDEDRGPKRRLGDALGWVVVNNRRPGQLARAGGGWQPRPLHTVRVCNTRTTTNISVVYQCLCDIFIRRQVEFCHMSEE